MAMGSLDMKTVNLTPEQLIMSQPVDMPIFQITDWSLDYSNFAKTKKGLRMVVVMKRKLTSEMMTTYFPTVLLTAITFATTFFKPFFFEAALSVNLTTMLVMTTIFISKMEGLPPTSDIKMLMPLNVGEEEEDSEEKTYRKCQRCQIPQLKTSGDNSLMNCKNFLKY